MMSARWNSQKPACEFLAALTTKGVDRREEALRLARNHHKGIDNIGYAAYCPAP